VKDTLLLPFYLAKHAYLKLRARRLRRRTA
jgi:hypothetical protein